MTDIKNIGDNIRRFRIEKGLTQKELGEKLDVTQQQIGQWETEKSTPKLGTIQKIALALDVPLFDIINLDMAMCLAERELALERQLNEIFCTLNQKGKEKALEQMELVAKIPEYRK